MILKLVFYKNQNQYNNITHKNSKNIFSVYTDLLKIILPDANNIIYGIIILIFIYVFVNIFISILSFFNGMPVIDNGKYFLNNKGDYSETTKEVYVKLKYIQLKMYSGHWIIFSILPMLHFLGKKKN
jgi:hypothetical protein